MALTTLSQIKAFLNITVDTQDAWLDALRIAAERAVKNYCGLEFEQATFTEFHDGNGKRAIVLRQVPVISITNLWLDHDGNFGSTSGSFSSSNLLTYGVDYSLEYDTTYQTVPISKSGLVYRIRTVWTRREREYVYNRLSYEQGPSIGNIKVEYIAGYPSTPDDLQYAVCLMVSYMKLTAAFGGMPLKSEKIGDYEYELFYIGATQAMSLPQLGSVRQILARYRDVHI